MRPVEKVLDRLEGVRKFNGTWKALCPTHDDREPSLSVKEGDDGRALLKCFAGCENPEIVEALGLEMKDLFEQRNGHRKKFVSTPPKTTATLQPCNLKNYAEAKGLSVEFLKGLGLTDRKYQGREAVRIPYRTETGEEKAARFRIGLEKSPHGYCWAHAPENAERRRRMASRAGKAKGNKEVALLKEELKALKDDVLTGAVDRNDAAVVVRIYAVIKDFVELERRVKETDELAAEIEDLKREYGATG